MLSDVNPDLDWEEFFSSWQGRSEVPTFTVINDREAVFSGRVLDLAEITAALTRSGCRPALVTVWADVLTVPADTPFAITEGMLQLQARRLQIDTTLRVTIDFRRAVGGGLTVFCAEQTGAIRVLAVHREAPPVVFTIDEPALIGGVQIRLVDGVPAQRPVTRSWGEADAGSAMVAGQQQIALRTYVDSLARGTEPAAELLRQVYDLYLLVLDDPAFLDHLIWSSPDLVERQYVVDDPGVLAELAKRGEARWVLSGDTPAFAAFDHVRLSTVRVWVDGAAMPDGGTVQVRMSTRVSCRDRFESGAYRITSKPLARDFAYRVSAQEGTAPAWRFPDGTYGHLEQDGAVDGEIDHAYFQPTPFAPWHVQVHGDGLDLTGVTRVVMEFMSSVVPQP